jgi:hypothetical protein
LDEDLTIKVALSNISRFILNAGLQLKGILLPKNVNWPMGAFFGNFFI